jgi:hypothetical protein
MEGDSQRLEFPPDITARTLGLPEGTDMGSYMFFLSEASHSERHYPNDPTARVMVKAWEVLQRHLGERLGPTPPDGFGGVFTDEAYRSGFYHVVGMLAERVFPGYKLAPKSPVGKIVLLRK